MAKKYGKLWTKEKAAIYTRVSTSYQVDKDSLPLQRKLCKAFCESHELDYVLFEDAGLSAKSEKRPAYQDMLKRIRAGEFSHLIVYKLDRISRNLLDFMGMYEELEELKVTFISLNENFDTNSAMGKAMLAIMIIFAQMEREIDSERVLAVMIGRAENTRNEVNQGKALWNGAQTPVGFRFDTEIMYPVPDPEEMKTLHLIFDMYEETRSSLVVSRYLNQNHIPSKRGGKWTSKVIADIIKNRFYIGEYSYNKRKSARGALKPQEEWVIRPNNHPAVIDIDQFNRCNEIMKSNRISKDKPNVRYVHIFSEVLYCHRCGSGVSSFKDKRRKDGTIPTVYRCTTRCRDSDAGCENSTTMSDRMVGNFVFTFLINFYHCYKTFKQIMKADEPTERLKILLLDNMSCNGLSIDESSVSDILSVLAYSSSVKQKELINLTDGKFYAALKNSAVIERTQKEIERCANALDRLTDLFLYSPDSITKDEYGKKRKELLEQKEGFEQELKKIKDGNSVDIPSFDKEEKLVSAFLLKLGLTNKSEGISFDDLYRNVDHKILKEFVRSIFMRIEWDYGKIVLIEFKNGVICKFTYQRLKAEHCPVCGKEIGTTLSCTKRTLPDGSDQNRRIRMGDQFDTYENSDIYHCEDCGVIRSRLHHWGCTKEICPICHKPLVTCEHGKIIKIKPRKKYKKTKKRN